jgi:hypothetical protein
MLEPENIDEEKNYDSNYVLRVVSKEAPKDERLAKQVFYTILSSKSNDPINLAINAPTGEGKTYVVQKVADLFPKNDVISLVGMSEKAVFHRPGNLVIKDEDGNYVPIKEKISELGSQQQACRTEIADTHDRNLKQAKNHEIKELEEQKNELYKNSKKLIDLTGVTLIFLDSPPAQLLEALMPLLSHDRMEVEYEFVDTYNGIKTHGNVIRGFPAVIFTAAKDYTNNPRYPEIQRRFLITNPQMSSDKYRDAVHCITTKYSLPDFVYQHIVVSDEEKERAKSIIVNIQNQIIDTCSSSLKHDHNQVFIPYHKSLESSLPSSDASYMNAAKTLFTWINLLATIHQRPKIHVMKSYLDETIPLATFDDLKEAMSLIEHNNGVRPYILRWFREVFMPAYESKKEPDSKPGRNSETLTENRIAVTSQDLINKTFEVQKKKLSPKQIAETYVNPLYNSNVISSEQSALDKRANIHYPVKSISENNKNLFDFTGSNNLSQHFNVRVEDPTLFPDQMYIISEISRVIKYSSRGDSIKLFDINGTERTVEEIVHQYYSNVDECFSTETRSIVCHTAIRYDSLITQHVSEEYYHNHQNHIKFQLISSSYTENTDNGSDKSKYLFDQSESNNFLSSKNDSEADGQLKDKNAGEAAIEYDTTDVGFGQIRKATGTVSTKKNLILSA